jgi:Domain of unknown function (DUF4251)
MNKLLFFLSILVLAGSCASSKVEQTAVKEPDKSQNTAREADIKEAVRMRRFIVKFDRLYISNGGQVDLIPKANYIILDGDRVIISAAYMGRQYSYRPIKGIDMVGRAVT